MTQAVVVKVLCTYMRLANIKGDAKMNGYYKKEIHIKKDATPIDNVTKFAWDDDDYEEVEIWHEYTEAELEEMEKCDEHDAQLDVFNSLPDAVADLSESVSDNAVNQNDIADAVAELSEIVSTLVEGAKNNG